MAMATARLFALGGLRRSAGGRATLLASSNPASQQQQQQRNKSGGEYIEVNPYKGVPSWGELTESAANTLFLTELVSRGIIRQRTP